MDQSADIDEMQSASARPALQRPIRTPPTFDGTVIKVSADAFSDEATGATFYEAQIEIPDTALASSRFTLLPGMPVEASLTTESRNVLSYLVKPLADSLSRTFRE